MILTRVSFLRWNEQSITRGTAFPRSGTDAEGDLKDFTDWVYHFIDGKTNELLKDRSYFKCYHPVNYQSRPLVSSAKNPHAPSDNAQLIPRWDVVEKTYWYMDWVAITEFFHESKCLLYYRLDPMSNQTRTYLDTTCHCQPSAGDVHDKKDLHHDGRRRKTMLDLDPALLASMAAMTTVDVQLFATALTQFVHEISWLEVSLGRRVLCDGPLKKWEPEFMYLGLNVTELYYNTTGLTV